MNAIIGLILRLPVKGFVLNKLNNACACCCCLVAEPFPTFCEPMNCSMPGFLVLHHRWSLLKLLSIESVIPHSHLILCHPLLLPSIFPSIRVFPKELVLRNGGQTIGASALASILPVNIQDWFPLGLTGLISLQLKGLSRVFSSITIGIHQYFSHFMVQPLSLIYGKTLTSIHDHWKNHIFDYNGNLLAKSYLWCLGLDTKFVIAFLPRSKCLLISRQQSLSPVILEPK